MIPYGRQQITEEDIGGVVEVLRSDFLTQGSLVAQFEQELCNYTGAAFGVATNSATSALHIACLAIGLKEGDWLWTSPITFVASANCGLYCGAKVDFVDIDPDSYNMSPQRLKEKLVWAEAENCLPKVVVVVHFAGLPCEMEEIRQLSNEYDFYLIEDGCHAVGGSYQGKAIGSGEYSDVTVFSFHPVKTITTGEGGVALTQNSELAQRMCLLRNHGITREPDQMTRIADGAWYYQQIELGFNYRMSDIQAALGLSQLLRLDQFIARRRQIAAHYSHALADLPLQCPDRGEEQAESGWHLYVVRLQQGEGKIGRDQLFDYLRGAGVGVQVHYIPLHTQPYYRQFGFQQGDFPQAEKYYREALSLPIYSDMDMEQQKYVVDTLYQALA